MTEAIQPFPFFESETARELNIKGFVGSYTTRLTTPVELVTLIRPPQTRRVHKEVLAYRSTKEDAEARGAALNKYLSTFTGYDEKVADCGDYDWGRTISAEIAYGIDAEETYRPVLEREGVRIVLAPTAIDKSNYNIGCYFQKGVDGLFIQGKKPLGGTDVTVSEDVEYIENKLAHPGVQVNRDMFATVIPLNDLLFSMDRHMPMLSFKHHLDINFREAVVELGKYPPFYGLRDEDIVKWQKNLLEKNLVGFSMCWYSIMNGAYPELFRYMNFELIQNNIHTMQNWTCELLLKLKRDNYYLFSGKGNWVS